MFEVPPIPEHVPADQRMSGEMSLRYEDIAQDGHLMLDAIPHALGEVVWRDLLAKQPKGHLLAGTGIIPILSRMSVENLEGPLPVRRSLEAKGAFQLAHTKDEQGNVNRLVLNLWVDVYGKRGRTYGPKQPGDGERIHVGRVFAEHVFTRLFAAPQDRKVVRFDSPGMDAVPPDVHDWRRPESLLELPAGATPLDAELSPDPQPIVLGMSHTDSNQHVNSLVYPRFFEEAALRRFDDRGKATNVLPRFAEMAYRKPSFAGERVRFLLRAFEHQGKLGAVGVLVDDRSGNDGGFAGQAGSRPQTPGDKRPRCFGRMLFDG